MDEVMFRLPQVKLKTTEGPENMVPLQITDGLELGL